jgi:hypothetical protein
MRQDAVKDYLERAGAVWPVVQKLLEEGELVETKHGRHLFYLRKLRAPGNIIPRCGKGGTGKTIHVKR